MTRQEETPDDPWKEPLLCPAVNPPAARGAPAELVPSETLQERPCPHPLSLQGAEGGLQVSRRAPPPPSRVSAAPSRAGLGETVPGELSLGRSSFCCPPSPCPGLQGGGA